MTIQEWVEANVKPNVLDVLSIVLVGEQQGSTLVYDVTVMAKTGEKTVNKLTQAVYKIGDNYFLGRQEIKNWVAPAPKKQIEQQLIEYLDATYGGPDGYTINPPIDTMAGKAGVITVNGAKKVIALFDGVPVVRNFSEV